MSVIVELTLPAHQFELGRIVQIEGGTSIILETMVPLGERSVPFFRPQDGHTAFEETVREHPAVDDIHVVNTHNGETLYALDWRSSDDTFLKGSLTSDAHLLEANDTARNWAFELRFPSQTDSQRFKNIAPTRTFPSTSNGFTIPQNPMPVPGTG